MLREVQREHEALQEERVRQGEVGSAEAVRRLEGEEESEGREDEEELGGRRGRQAEDREGSAR